MSAAVTDWKQRFWLRVDRSAGDAACWPWTGASSRGYGSLRVGGVLFSAHRVAYELTNQKIPEGLLVRHSCDNPPCCNPAHLLLGTESDNRFDMYRRGRQGKRLYRRGQDHPNSKLTSVEVNEIRDEYATGTVSQSTLARRYGVTPRNVCYIVNGKGRCFG